MSGSVHSANLSFLRFDTTFFSCPDTDFCPNARDNSFVDYVFCDTKQSTLLYKISFCNSCCCLKCLLVKATLNAIPGSFYDSSISG